MRRKQLNGRGKNHDIGQIVQQAENEKAHRTTRTHSAMLLRNDLLSLDRVLRLAGHVPQRNACLRLTRFHAPSAWKSGVALHTSMHR